MLTDILFVLLIFAGILWTAGGSVITYLMYAFKDGVWDRSAQSSGWWGVAAWLLITLLGPAAVFAAFFWRIAP